MKVGFRMHLTFLVYCLILQENKVTSDGGISSCFSVSLSRDVCPPSN